MKTYADWLSTRVEHISHTTTPEALAKEAWDFQEEQWRHHMKNKEAALQLKSDAFELLKKAADNLRKKNKELESALADDRAARTALEAKYKQALEDLNYLTLQIFQIHEVEGAPMDYDSEQAKKIRKRHKLDEKVDV